MGYFKDAIKGVTWMGALRILMRFLAIAKIAILARILSPSQFGNYGIALLVLGFLEVLTETGINVFLIQEKGEVKNYLNSAWVVSIIRGVLISLLILLATPFVISFYNVPTAKNLLFIVSAISLTRGFINPMVVTFQKNMQFKKEFLFLGFLYLLDIIVAIVLGIFTHSESSMLISMLTAAMVEVLLSFLIFKQKPKFIFQKAVLSKVFNRGKWVTMAGVFNYVFQNIDNAVVGKILGTSQLGFYQQAYSISSIPVSEVGQIFNKVTFPLFVNINTDLPRLKKAFIKTILAITAIVVPFAILIYFFSRPIILIFLGPKWLAIEPVLKILAIFGVLKSLLNYSYTLFLSLKLQKYIMLSELFGITGMIIAVFPLTLKFGIIGTATSTIIAFIFSLPMVIYGIGKVFQK